MIQIREGHSRPEFRLVGTRQLLEQLPDSPFLTVAEAAQLRRAYGFLRSLETFARIDADTNLSAVPAEPEVLDALGRWLQLADPPGRSLREAFKTETQTVRGIFESVIARLQKG
jgi:glutamine synthetase adenylyltransferase